MKKIKLFFIGIFILGFLSQQISASEILTEDQQLAEGQKVVDEMEKEDENEKGIYFFDAIKQKIVKFFNYNDEFDSTTTPKITKEGGSAVYSIGDELFIKKLDDSSFKNDEDLGIGDFGEIGINENSVKLFKTEISGETLTLSWKDEEKFDGYFIQVKDSVDGFLDGDSKSLVYVLIKEDEIDGISKKRFFISDNLKNNEKIFLTEKKFEGPELKIFLNENFFYAKIFGISKGKISTASAQKILYGNTKNLPPKKISKIEKVNFPILVKNYLDVKNLFSISVEDGDFFSWDFNGDDVFEKKGEKILLPVQQDLGDFFVNLKIRKKNGNEFIKKIQLHFFSPKIFFDKKENGKIFGHIEPKIQNFPVFYTYENEENLKKFGEEKIFTDKNGEFSFFMKSQKKSRMIYGEHGEKLGEIFLKKGDVELKIGKNGQSLILIKDGEKNIAVIYGEDFLSKIIFFDKSYYLIFPQENKFFDLGKSFYIFKNGEKQFYFNFENYVE